MNFIVYFSRQSPDLPGQYDDKYRCLNVYEGTGEARGIFVQILLEKEYNPKDINAVNIATTSWFTEDDLHLVRRAMDGVPALVAKTILEGTTINDVLKAIRVDLKIDVQ